MNLEGKDLDIVNPGEWFSLFEPKRTSFSGGNLEGDIYSHIGLQTKFAVLPFEVVASDNIGTLRVSAFTPFQPELGYTLTEEDLNPQLKIQKLARLIKEEGLKELPSQHSRLIFLALDGSDLEKSGLCRVTDQWEEEVTFMFYPGALEWLKSLRIIMNFPNRASFMSKINLSGSSEFKNYLYVNKFFPTDLGPLPKIPESELEALKLRYSGVGEEGLKLYGPNNIDQLYTIRSKFIFFFSPILI